MHTTVFRLWIHIEEMLSSARVKGIMKAMGLLLVKEPFHGCHILNALLCLVC